MKKCNYLTVNINRGIIKFITNERGNIPMFKKKFEVYAVREWIRQNWRKFIWGAKLTCLTLFAGYLDLSSHSSERGMGYASDREKDSRRVLEVCSSILLCRGTGDGSTVFVPSAQL